MKIRLLAPVLLALAVFASPALADGVLDPLLQQRMQIASGPHEVIVTFRNMEAVNRLADELGVGDRKSVV